MTDHLSIFAASAIALYAAHHVGDYWVQTDHQAKHKGDAGHYGRAQCLMHVGTYTMTQVLFLFPLAIIGLTFTAWQGFAAISISGVTHYLADRREHGLMFWLARRLPGKANFLTLGAPRMRRVKAYWGEDDFDAMIDNPSLGTGAWALDQSWHIFWGVFVAALVFAI